MSDVAKVPREVNPEVIEDLGNLLGDRITTTMAVREHHGHAEDYYAAFPPDAVCIPNSNEEVA